MLPAPKIVSGRGAGVVPFSGAPDSRGGGNNALFQPGHSGTGLEGGAGRIGALRGSVEQGVGGVLGKSGKSRAVRGQIERRIGGQGQHLSGADLNHSGTRSAGGVSVLIHIGDGICKGLLRRFL